ncbi:MAG: hypothetical protein AAF502_04095 [Bacteroidota bacterium]
MRLPFLLAFILLVFSFSILAQGELKAAVDPPKSKDDIVLLPGLANLKPNKALQIAEELYRVGDKAGAYHYYLAYHAKRRGNKYAQYRLAETALFVRNYLGAHNFANGLLKKEKKFPKVHYYNGIALKSLGEYDKAVTEMNKYMIKYNLTGEDSILIAQQIEGAVVAAAHRPARNIKVKELNKDINTIHSENGGAMAAQGLLFTHVGEAGSIIRLAMNPETGRSKVVSLSGTVNRAGYQNSDPFLSEDGKTLFFTRCKSSNTGEVDCSIYAGTLQEKGKVTNVHKLGKGINQPGYLAMQPIITKNEFGREILYFVSNRPGGFGGFDIWYSMRLNDGSFTRAYNVGRKINSDFNETTPYYENQGSTLFFSSDHPTGFGGFDVYRIQGLQRYWEKAYNMGMPVNSSTDDYYFRKTDEKTGYLSSNRAGTKYAIHENDSDDMFIVKFE